MLETHLRPIFQKHLFDPLANALAKHLTANQVTGLSLLFGLAFIPAAWADLPLLATALLILSGLLDVVDGSIARLRDESSMTGALYDILSDRTVEAGIIIGLFLVAPDARGFMCLLMLASVLLCVSTFLMAGIFEKNEGEKSFHYSPGLMERAEAFIFFLAMLWWPAAFAPLAGLFTLLVIYTAAKRMREICQQA